jgi:hypothetical protein
MNLNQFSTKIDVAAASMAELVAFYNSFAGKAIKKFETRAVGVARCTAMLKPEGAPDPVGVDLEKADKATVTRISKAEPTARKAARKPSPVTVHRPTPDGSAMSAIAKTVVKAEKPKAKVAAAKPKASKPKATNATPRGKALFTEDGVITVKHKGENPKRGTAAERFELYRSGMTVAAYILSGGQRRDVVWDQHQGWISVKG